MVGEQMPGYFVYEDRTGWLVSSAESGAIGPGQGYWASYNIPFFPEISVVSGFAAACEIGSEIFGSY